MERQSQSHQTQAPSKPREPESGKKVFHGYKKARHRRHANGRDGFFACRGVEKTGGHVGDMLFPLICYNELMKKFIAILIFIIIILLGGDIYWLTAPKEESTSPLEQVLGNGSLELAPEQVEATITDENGEEVVIDNIVTVETVDGGNYSTEFDGDTDTLGQGGYSAPLVTVATPLQFANATLGNCYDIDGYYGAQCVDLSALFTANYSKTYWSTCGTGAARGIWQCKEGNAGTDYVLITEASAVQAGDWVIYDGGTYGHVGMAMGKYNNGYVTLLGQNQGGASCSVGGQATNIINKSMSDFLGAFRPRGYITEEASAETAPSTVSALAVEWGDTLGAIMLEREGKLEWGQAMREYASHWRNTRTGQTVLQGWDGETGVGLIAGDTYEWVD